MKESNRSKTHDASPERSKQRNEGSNPDNQSSLLLPLSIVLALAILIRSAALWLGGESLEQDPDAYLAIASTIHQHGVFGLTAADGQVIPTSFRPPLYPAILSTMVNQQGSVSLFALAVAHLLLGVVTAALSFLGVRQLLTIDQPATKLVNIASFCGAMLVVIDPILLQQSTYAMTETLAACLTSFIFWTWTRSLCSEPTASLSVLRGIALASAFLCRPTFLAWAILLLSGEAAILVLRTIRKQQHPSRGIVFFICIPVAILLLTVSIWTKRNEQATGHPAWATTHGGYTLLLGNNPLFYEHLETGGAFKQWDATSFTQAYAYRFAEEGSNESFWMNSRPPEDSPQPPPQDLTEHEDDQWSYRAAIATIKRSPSTFATACFNRLYRLWTPLPFGTSERTGLKRVAITAYYLFVYTLAAIGIITSFRNGQQRFLWPALSLLLALSLIHTLYWSNLRMRAPAIPLIAVCASIAIAEASMRPTLRERAKT